MAEVPKEISDACRDFRQGDLLEGAPVLEAVDTETPLGSGIVKQVEALRGEGRELPPYIALGIGTPYSCVISQTCDIVQDNKRGVVIAPVIPHEDPNGADVAGDSNNQRKRREKRAARIEQAKSGRRPHVIHFGPFADPRFPAGGYVDLTTLTTIQKPILAKLTGARFIGSETERRKFAWRCAHVLERPAIPDLFVKHVTNPLRDFLFDLDNSDVAKINAISATVGEEWLKLDDADNPHVAQLYFLGDAEPSAEAQEILDEWWEEVSSAMPGGYSLLPNGYRALGGVSLAESRTLNLITHWYLSDEDDT